jgi:hypothetical protein
MKVFFLRICLAIALVALAGVAALYLIQRGDLQAARAEVTSLRAEVESLRAAAEELEQLRKQLEKLKAEAVDPLEVARLRSRAGELDKVKVQLEQAKAQAAAAPAPTAPPEEKKAMTPPPRTAQGTVELAAGQSFVTGGWDMGNGRRAYAFVSPQVQQADDGSAIVVMRAQLVEIPEAAAGALGLQGVTASGNEAAQVGLLDGAQIRTTLQSLRGTEGVGFLSAPVMSTRMGDSGTIQIGDIATGSGVSLQFKPQVTPSGQLNVDFSFNLPGGAPR